MDTLTSYDELPYDSQPLPETQADFLAAVAKLHGFDAPAPTHARILELGCAQGGNLIPLASRWPQSECVGVELSRVQAEAGATFIRQLGLSNVRIQHGDLAALPGDLGEFDYIIAHGVFSWVPPAVQQALLDVCRRHLSPHGVAYISFNVAAGWAHLQPLRSALIERTEADLPAPVRYEQALRVLAELEAEWRDPVLLKEITYLKSAAPSYLFHEYLAEFNAPMAFGEFAGQLDAHGLRYIGEAGPRHAVVELEDAWGLSPENMTGRWLEAEAKLDAALAIRFRRALIARADAPCAQPPQAPALSSLMFYADLRSDDEIDLEDASEQRFINPAGKPLPVAQPVMKAAVIALSNAYPDALTYSDLLTAARRVMSECCGSENIDDSVFQGELFKLVMAHGIMPSIGGEFHAVAPGERPCAHALARLQARSTAWRVCGLRHVALDLDPLARTLLGLLDGSRNVDELKAIMRATLVQDGFERHVDDVSALTNQQLWLFSRQGLLVG